MYDLKRNIIAERRKDNINDREASKHIKEIEQISNNFYNKINRAWLISVGWKCPPIFDFQNIITIFL